MILSRCPDLPLTPYIECVWHYECAVPSQYKERVLPDGRFHLMLNLEAGVAAVAGLRSHHVVVDAAQKCSVMGAVFRPGAARAFLTAPAIDFCDRAIPLDLIWGRLANQLLDRLREVRRPDARLRIMEEALINRMGTFREKHLPMHPIMAYALHAFGNAPHIHTVAGVSREIGWSRRWLSHAFAEQVGMTPKRYCRLIRFRHVMQEIASQRHVDWVGIALAGGFCDQAHLVHEFRAFSGLSPEMFLKSERPFPNHVRIG